MQSTSPRVSVVMPAYNVERYVRQAIDSVLAQTEPAVEVIVVDDRSSDRTAEIVDGIGDERVRLVRSGANGGPSVARNRALDEARGEWIAFLDADDWFAPSRLERMLDVAGAWDAEMAIDDVNLVEDGADQPWGSLFETHGLRLAQPRAMALAEYVAIDLGLGKPIVRRDFVLRNALAFDETLQRVEDLRFCVDCLLRGARLVLVPEAGYFYRARRRALTSDRVEVNRALALVADRLADDPRVAGDAAVSRSVERLRRRARDEIRYYELVRLVKARRPAALAVLARSPGVAVTALRHLPWVIRSRASRSGRTAARRRGAGK
ncbi:MAG TPA: glycosyltransferase family 2 protein [Candidatus Limnocylindrales bacterium]